jgi:hypothetical protein
VNLLKEFGRTKEGKTTCCGHISRGFVFSKFVQLYELWHIFQGRFVGDCFFVL